jgi:acetyl esterase
MEPGDMKLDRDAEKVVALITAAGRPPMEALTPAEGRLAYAASRAALVPDAPAVGEVLELAAPGPAGAIPLRLYRATPLTAGNLQPLLIYYHGGGFVLGDLDSHDVLCRSLALNSGATVVSVHYRLAPEAKFPAAAEDAMAVLDWMSANAARIGTDPNRIAVGGDSAGGNLAAVVSIHARDRGLPKLALQLLLYPATDLHGEYQSYRRHAQQLPLKRATMDWFLAHYLRGNADKRDWRASPILAESLAGVAPAHIITAGFDLLVDEGRAYADALGRAGVSMKYSCYEGQIHGFMTMGRLIAQADAAILESAAALKAAWADVSARS